MQLIVAIPCASDDNNTIEVDTTHLVPTSYVVCFVSYLAFGHTLQVPPTMLVPEANEREVWICGYLF